MARAAAKTKDRPGRYSRAGASVPGPDLPAQGPRAGGKIEIVHAVVDDPNPTLDPGQNTIGRRQQRVAINRKTDVLEIEHSYGRLSQGAYNAGLEYQRVLEIASGRRRGGISMEPASCVGDREIVILRALERAERAVAWQYEARRVLGEWAEGILEAILGKGLTIGQVSEQAGFRSRYGRAEIGRTFREGLEDLAQHIERNGRPKIRA